MATKRTVQELIDSLTGFEEIGIEKATGYGLEYWGDTGRRLVVTRIMAAIVMARKEAGDKRPSEAQIKAAYQHVQGLKQNEIDPYFEDEEPEIFEDEPVTAQGKDDSGPGETPAGSQSSASLPE